MNNRTLARTIVATFAITCAIVSTAFADSRVGGYTTKRGTYVAPHYKSSPDKSKLNNYSSKGNFNPYTGKRGTVDPFKAPRIR